MNNIFTAFKEHKDFSKSIPFSVIYTTFDRDELVAPHYAETVEILLFSGATGEVIIGGHRYKLSGNQVFYIPPETVHSMSYKKSSGNLLNVKLSPEGFSPFLSFEALLASEGKSLMSIDVNPDCFDEILPIVNALAKAGDIFSATSIAVSLFSLLRTFSREEVLPSGNAFDESELREIINYTKLHFREKISISDIAEKMGYSKFYFCTKFRESAGITYLSYLNGVRISEACKMLKNGSSVSEAAEGSGFSDVPYFVQLFKKIKGTTPKRYANDI